MGGHIVFQLKAIPPLISMQVPLAKEEAGEARKATTRSVQAARIASDDSRDTVEQSTTTAGTFVGSASSPSSPRSPPRHTGPTAWMIQRAGRAYASVATAVPVGVPSG